MEIKQILNDFSVCGCGKAHTINIKEIVIGSGVCARTGDILKKNNFGKRLLLVADKNTLRASEGIGKSLCGFDVTYKIYDDMRLADMRGVESVEALSERADGILSAGTGSLNDICRLAAFRRKKPFAVFATAASMDGFASDGAPIIHNGFKETYQAKAPEVIIADTRILAAAPAELKSAGFGDMMGKYIGLIDWQVSNLLSNEYYCPKVAALTRKAADTAFSLCGKVLGNDEEIAGRMFEALVLTGLGMAFANSSRPASGTEHILSHFWECMKLQKGELSDFHGKKVGVATVLIKREYEAMSQKPAVTAKRETIDWEKVYSVYGNLAPEIRKLNAPPITEALNPDDIGKNWDRIREIINSVPPASGIEAALTAAGCPIDTGAIGISPELKETGLKFHPFMRKRLSLMRLKTMLV